MKHLLRQIQVWLPTIQSERHTNTIPVQSFWFAALTSPPSSLMHLNCTTVICFLLECKMLPLLFLWLVKKGEHPLWFSFYLIIVNSLNEDSFNLCTRSLMSYPHPRLLVPGVICSAGTVCAVRPRRTVRELCADRVGNRMLPSLCRVLSVLPSSTFWKSSQRILYRAAPLRWEMRRWQSAQCPSWMWWVSEPSFVIEYYNPYNP